MHVLAIGRLDTAVSPYSSSCRKPIDGVGLKPMGGTAVAPVAKLRFFSSLEGPSSSLGKKGRPYSLRHPKSPPRDPHRYTVYFSDW